MSFPQQEPNPYSGPNPNFQNPNFPQPKPGMSTFMKVLLFLLIGGGGMAALCCGIGGYLAWDMFPTTKPQEVSKLTREIAQIDIPEKFRPLAGMNFWIFKLKMVIYVAENNGHLLLLQVPAGEGGHAAVDQMRARLNEEQRKGGKQERVNFEAKGETRQFEVNGEKCDFRFRKGTGEENKLEYLEVTGQFPAKNGSAILTVIAPVSEFSEEEIEKLIRSIKK